MSRCRHIIQAGAVVGMVLAGLAHGEDWPRWRGPLLNGISSETGWLATWPQNGPSRLWQVKVGVGYSTVSVSQGRLYTMGNTDDQDTVYCLDAKTGQEVWKHTYACKQKDPNGYHGTRGTPTVDGQRVYTVSREGHLFCLNAADGKVIWSKNYVTDFKSPIPRWGFATSPLVEGDLLIVEPGAKGASVVAFNKVDGKVVWQSGDDAASYSSPVAYTLDGVRCVAVVNAKFIVGRRMQDGKELWRHPWETSYDINAATPVIEGNKVFISSGYNHGAILLQIGNEGAPKKLWENTNMRNHVDSCILWQGCLFGFDDNSKELRCLDLQSGEIKWAQKGFGKGSLMMVGGKAIIYSDRGLVAVAEISPTGFKELARYQALEAKAPQGRDTWASPVLSNGRLYCRSLEDLVCLDLTVK